MRWASTLGLALVAILVGCSSDPAAELTSEPAINAQSGSTTTAPVAETTTPEPWTADDIKALLLDAGVLCGGESVVEGDQEAIDSITCQNMVIKTYASAELARVDTEIDQQRVYELLVEIAEIADSDEEVQPRLWVTGGPWIVLCDNVALCGEIQQVLGGTIERYPVS